MKLAAIAAILRLVCATSGQTKAARYESCHKVMHHHE